LDEQYRQALLQDWHPTDFEVISHLLRLKQLNYLLPATIDITAIVKAARADISCVAVSPHNSEAIKAFLAINQSRTVVLKSFDVTT